MVIGKVSSDIAIRKGKVVSQAHVFVTEKGEVWAGPVHYHGEENLVDTTGDGVGNYTGWMGGGIHVPGGNQPLLRRIPVMNNKIQDFRLTQKIDKLNLDFSILEKELLTNITKSTKVDTNIVRRQTAFFTDLCLSRDQDGNCRFFFGIDVKKIVRESSVYGKMFVDNSSIEQVLSKVRILSMKIYRERIDSSPGCAAGGPFKHSKSKLFDPHRETRTFNTFRMDKEPPMMTRSFQIGPNSGGGNVQVLFTNEGKYPLVNVVEDVDGNSQVTSYDGISDIAPVSNIFSQNQDLTGIKYFSGVDRSISELSEGYHKYYIELEIQDGTVDFLKEKLQELINEKERLLEYYTVGSRIGLTGIAEAKEIAPSVIEEDSYAGRVMESNFDPIANRFTQKFIEWCEKYYNTQSNPPVWESAFDAYASVLSIFGQFFEGTELADAIINFVNPISGNLQGVMKVIELFDQLENKLREGIRTTQIQKFVVTEGDTSSERPDVIQALTPISSIKLKHKFSNVFDATIPKNFGFDFLGLSTNQTSITNPGLRQVSSETFASIVKKEKEKIFEGNPSIGISKFPSSGDSLSITDYTYLTPAIIRTITGGKILFSNIKTESTDFALTLKNEARQNALKSSTSRSPFQLPIISETLTPQTLPPSRIGPIVQSQTNPAILTGGGRAQTSTEAIMTPTAGPTTQVEEKFVKADTAKFSTFMAITMDALASSQGGSNFKGQRIQASIGGGENKAADPVQWPDSGEDGSNDNAPSSGKGAGGVSWSSSQKYIPTENDIKQSENLWSFLADEYSTIVVVDEKDSVKDIKLPGEQDNFSEKKESDEGRLISFKDSGDEQIIENKLALSIGWEVLKNGTSNAKFCPSVGLDAEQVTSINLNFYNPNSTNGFMANTSNITPNVVRNLPNPIKALIKFSDTQNPTSAGTPNPQPFLNAETITSLSSNPFSDPEQKVRNKFFFEIFDRIEVLTGYDELNSMGELSLKMPIWQPLDRNIFNAANGKFLLCRLRSYENINFKITRQPNLELPTLDECFLLQGGSVLLPPVPTTPSTSTRPTLASTTPLGIAPKYATTTDPGIPLMGRTEAPPSTTVSSEVQTLGEEISTFGIDKLETLPSEAGLQPGIGPMSEIVGDGKTLSTTLNNPLFQTTNSENLKNLSKIEESGPTTTPAGPTTTPAGLAAAARTTNNTQSRGAESGNLQRFFQVNNVGSN